MTDEEKLARLKLLLPDVSVTDTVLQGYLAIAQDEILNWLYINVGTIPEEVVSVPAAYEQVQIMSCVAGYNMLGAETERTHSENGVSVSFRYSDMLSYIHAHVYPYVGIPR